jgi:nucleoside-diphosphate-sugar epimerase
LHSQGRAELLDFSPVRDFIHVHDVAEGLIQLLLARSEKKGHLRVNLSSGKGYSVGGVAKAALKVFALSPQAITERQSPSHSQQIGLPSSLVLDNSLLRRITGWSPVFDLESGLRQAMNERSGQN